MKGRSKGGEYLNPLGLEEFHRLRLMAALDQATLEAMAGDLIFWRREATRKAMICSALSSRLPHVDVKRLEAEIEQILKVEAA